MKDKFIETSKIKKSFFILFFLPFLSFSQYTIKGKVSDSNQVIPFANVVFTSTDNKLITSTVSNSDGVFLIKTSITQGIITVTFAGFEEWKKEIVLQGDTDLGTIVLSEEKIELDNVTVKSEKKLIERKVDRLIFNVENSIAATGSDGLETLRLVPGVKIQNGIISLVGKSEVLVMVNERVIKLTGEELASYIKTLSGEEIKKIEVITNPSARYDASGNSGIINFVTKKQAQDAWKNTIVGSYAQRQLASGNLRNNFTYKKDKIRFLLNLDYNEENMIFKEDIFSGFEEGEWRTYQQTKRHRNLYTGRFEFDYSISKNTTIGVQYYNNTTDAKKNINGNSYIIENSQNYILKNNSNSHFEAPTNTFNTHFTSVLDTLGRKIDVDLDYFYYGSDQRHDFDTDRLDADMNFINKDLLATNKTILDVENYSAKVDIFHPTKLIELTYGGKIGITKNNSSTQFFDNMSGTPVIVPENTNQFNYKENIEALYVEGLKKIGKKIELQLGLRLENTHIDTQSVNPFTEINSDYLNFFPSFYLSYEKNENNTFSFNYGKRIKRPGFLVLTPFRFYTNSFMYSIGNPFLSPSINHNFEFSHTYKNDFVTNVFYSYQSNGFDFMLNGNEETNETVLKMDNFFNQSTYGVSQSYTTKIFPWWETSNNVDYYYVSSEAKKNITTINNVDQFSFNVRTDNTFILNKSKSLKGQVGFWYNSPFAESLYKVSGSSSLDLIMKYSVLENNLNFTAGFYDVFNNSTSYRVANINNIRQEQNYYGYTRYFKFSLSYSFGNNKMGSKERKFGNDQEIKRL
jgi:iron complex outermembrane receptor protein